MAERDRALVAPAASSLRVVVDDDGLLIAGDAGLAVDRPVDIHFGDQRIGSFWLLRDTEARDQRRWFPWPDVLRPYLDGRTRLALIDHRDEVELCAAEVVLGSGRGQIRVVDKQGNPLGWDKSQRLGRLFGTRSREHLDPLLDSIEHVLQALRGAGIRPFLAYGTLLGAVRAGRFIGHDSDADLGYVSEHEHPVDVILESFRIQRALVAQGYQITRYSGLAFKIVVREADGSRRGLDVFGGFLRDGMLYLMGEVGSPFRPEWVHPLSTVTLEGRELAAPAQPERLLEATYGEGWRVPDPAYRFETPEPVRRRLNGWFRGTRAHRETVWNADYARSGSDDDRGGSAFASWVSRREPDAARVVDVGCGFGADVAFFAAAGVPVIGLDYNRRAFARRARWLARHQQPATFRWTNLTELRSVLPTGAWLARTPGPTVMIARHVADATNGVGRRNLLRLARLALGAEGVLYLQFLTRSTDDAPLGVKHLRADRLVRQIEFAGGRVVERHELAADVDVDVDSASRATAPPGAGRGPYLCRLVVRWDR